LTYSVSHSTPVLKTALHELRISVWFRFGFQNGRSVLQVQIAQKCFRHKHSTLLAIQKQTEHIFTVNWTSTQVPLWQIDCDEFRKVGRPFELRDVTTPEHENFCAVFSIRVGWKFKKEGTTVLFSPQ
jgi:hypothetical protein